MPTKVFLAQPSYGPIEHESYQAVERASTNEQVEIHVMRRTSSLLANCFNCSLATCLNQEPRPDVFVLLHADVVPMVARDDVGWLDVALAEMDRYDYDVIHAPCAIKDGTGTTSTGVAFSNDPWQPIRRLTTSELVQLPETFSLDELQQHFDPAAKALLPNTGCLVMRLGRWIEDFPGFEIRDQLLRINGEWKCNVLSEDWNFGFWAAGRSDCVVGATRKVTTRHIGKAPFTTEHGWGQARDEEFFELRGKARRAA